MFETHLNMEPAPSMNSETALSLLSELLRLALLLSLPPLGATSGCIDRNLYSPAPKAGR